MSLTSGNLRATVAQQDGTVHPGSVTRTTIRRLFAMDRDMSYQFADERWYLSDPLVDGKWVPGSTFTRGSFYEGPRPAIPLCQPGPPVDMTFSTTCDVLIVTETVAALFDELAPGAVQRIPVGLDVGGIEPRELLNVLPMVPCLDVARSYTDPNVGRPGYKLVASMHLLPEPTEGHDVFRVAEWTGSVIVSERIKEALDRLGVTGARFTDVT